MFSDDVAFALRVSKFAGIVCTRRAIKAHSMTILHTTDHNASQYLPNEQVLNARWQGARDERSIDLNDDELCEVCENLRNGFWRGGGVAAKRLPRLDFKRNT